MALGQGHAILDYRSLRLIVLGTHFKRESPHDLALDPVSSVGPQQKLPRSTNRSVQSPQKLLLDDKSGSTVGSSHNRNEWFW